jgi:SAM-dependent methyltransferase
MKPDGFDAFFQGIALEAWRKVNPPDSTAREADFLERVLQPRPGARLLDVPSGEGRLALELAGRGYRLTGVEHMPDCIREARAQADARGLAVEWHQADMRRLPWRERFAGAFCFGNSQGLLDPPGTLAFLRALGRALKPGGRLVLDSELVAESLLPGLEERVWQPVEDILVLVEHRYDLGESRLDTDYTFVKGGERVTRRLCHWVYTVGELQRMVSRCGMATRSLLGSLELEPYQVGSPRLLLVAEKER